MHLTPWTTKVADEVKKVESMFFGQIFGKIAKRKRGEMYINVPHNSPEDKKRRTGTHVRQKIDTKAK